MNDKKQAIIDAIRAKWRDELEAKIADIRDAEQELDRAIESGESYIIKLSKGELRGESEDYERLLLDMELEIARALADEDVL